MSGWDPHRDLARLLAALGQEIVASAEPEVRTACFDEGDSIHAAAKDVRALIGALSDDADKPEAGVRPLEAPTGPKLWAWQH